jgi:uncharacterized membrane protein YjjP (DUF1212 family)
MSAAGEPSQQVDERLRTIARSYGAPDARVSVLSSVVVLALGPHEAPTFEEASWLGGSLRLDQADALYGLVEDAELATVRPAEGLARLHAIVASKPRYGWAMTILAHVVLTAGLCLVLRPTPRDFAAAVVFGALVGVANRIASRWRSLGPVMPFLAAFGVAAPTFALANANVLNADYQALIPPLVSFIPGVTLTMGVVELAAGHMVAGASRVAFGTLQLLLLAVGIVAGAALAGTSPPDHLATEAAEAWAPWIGVAVFGLGMLMYFSGHLNALPWLLVVLYGGWIAQVLGNELLGGYLSGFVGALVMTPLAFAVERRPTAPPALVTLVPGYWLLVPGAVGLLGVAEVLGNNHVASLDDLGRGAGGILAIALGALCGYALRPGRFRVAAGG